MTIFVEQKGSEIVSSVQYLGTNFSELIKAHAKIIKTAEGREYATLPLIFERVDDSDVFIIRNFNTKYIDDKFKSELKHRIITKNENWGFDLPDDFYTNRSKYFVKVELKNPKDENR